MSYLICAAKEIDPVYSLLKCAADLPRVVRPSKDTSCTGLLARHGDSSGSTSKASSPSSSGKDLSSLKQFLCSHACVFVRVCVWMDVCSGAI